MRQTTSTSYKANPY